MTNHIAPNAGIQPVPPAPPAVQVQSCFRGDQEDLLGSLEDILAACNAWVLERRLASESTLELSFEIHISETLELYARLMAAGLQLTRASHAALTGLCASDLRRPADLLSTAVVELRLELTFLEDLPPHFVAHTRPGNA